YTSYTILHPIIHTLPAVYEQIKTFESDVKDKLHIPLVFLLITPTDYFFAFHLQHLQQSYQTLYWSYFQVLQIDFHLQPSATICNTTNICM
ncbi:MAG: hypothetical protein ACRCX1_09275, partial [Bacteroidales bacterium]